LARQEVEQEEWGDFVSRCGCKEAGAVSQNPNPRSSTLRETKSVVQGERERRESSNTLVLCEV
jgi:formylglycine-generating enzyme required for sulfatase activity